MSAMYLNRRSLLLGCTAIAVTPPSVLAQRDTSTVVDETWRDAARARDLPVRIRWPATAGPGIALPVVLFSHGLGGTRDGGAVWGEAWAGAGFVVVHMQHPGSDLPAVRAAVNASDARRGLRETASAMQLLARLRDVVLVLDEIGRRQRAGQDRWAAVRTDRIGMSGHSFGAHTTLGVAGQTYPGFEAMREPRLAAFIAFSPTAPAGAEAKAAFAGLDRPVLSITGTRDDDVVGNGATPERRMAVFPALPVGNKAHLVLQDADHMTFAGQTGRLPQRRPREAITRDLEPRHHALIARISTDWWRAMLQDDVTARARLQAPADLGKADVWQQK